MKHERDACAHRMLSYWEMIQHDKEEVGSGRVKWVMEYISDRRYIPLGGR